MGIDHISELVEMSKQNIMKDNPGLLDSGRVRLFVGDGRQGYSELGPYDAIHVGAAAPTLPQQLVDQLKVSSMSMNSCKVEMRCWYKITRLMFL